MKKLLITGCSWACGEWDNMQGTNRMVLSHPGVTKYLSEDFTVTNIAKGGGSNWTSCYSIENYLRHVVNPKDDLEIIVFQTDPLRPGIANVFNVDYSNLINNANNLYELHQTLVEIFYIKLNSIAENHNCKIHLVGAYSDLDLETLSLYPRRLVALCPSWIKLLNNQHNPSVIPLTINPLTVEFCKEQNRLDLCDELFRISEYNFIEAEQLMESSMFGPAYGDFHPSRSSHEILANYIRQFFLETQDDV
jgi:hypothetical protein